MVVWIVVGVVVASLLFLVLVTVALLRRLPTLQWAVLRLQERATQAQGMQTRGEDLQRHAYTLAESADRMQAGIAGIQSRLPGRGDTGRG